MLLYILIIIIVGDAQDPHPYIKLTIDDPTSISSTEEPALLKLIPITQQLNTEPLSIKIELVRDSEFFHLLLHELSHAAALHDKEKDRFIGDVDTLESQLIVAVNDVSLFDCVTVYLSSIIYLRLHLKRKICTLGEKYSPCIWKLPFLKENLKVHTLLSLMKEVNDNYNGSPKSYQG
jgi:hypothetical protein